MHQSMLYALTVFAACTTAAQQQPISTLTPGCSIIRNCSATRSCDDTEEVPIYSGVGSARHRRTFLVHKPPTYQDGKPLGMVISYHGANRDAANQEALSEFSTAKNQDLIAVYPQGYKVSWEGPDYHDVSVTNDTLFTSDILDYMTKHYCIDETRIYASGKSNGGGFVDTLACSPVGRKFAAFAAAAGAFYTETQNTTYPCDIKVKAPFLEFHGLMDPTMHYNGGDNTGKGDKVGGGPYVSVPTALQRWAVRNGCSASDSNNTQTTTFHDHNNTVLIYNSWNCSGNIGIVQGYAISDLEHVWPSTVLNVDDFNKNGTKRLYDPSVVNATDLMLAFFKKYSLPVPKKGQVDSLPGEL